MTGSSVIRSDNRLCNFIIARNSSGCVEYDENSFIGCLHEQNIWHREEYWLLEKALYDLSEQSNEPETNHRIFCIFSRVFLLLCAHYDDNDVFHIENLSRQELYDLRERWQVVFEGYFSGYMPSQTIFEIANPLLKGN